MKKAHFLPGHLLIVVIAILALMLAGCDGAAGGIPTAPGTGGTQPPDSDDGRVAFEPLAQGLVLRSTQSEPALRMAVDGESMKTLAELVTPEHQTLLADIDFDKNVVLAVFWGVRPSGGASISVEKVTLAGNELTVAVRLNADDPNVPRVEAATYPYHLVSLARAALPAGADLRYRLVSAETLLAEGNLP